jgi:uncharacterized protein
VILVDANILIYAHVSSFDQHQGARDWLDRQLNGSALVGLPWASLLAFLRLVTNSRVFEHPESIFDAWVQLRTWLACVHGNLVPDAHLAALAVEHGLTLCSTDGDFSAISRS